jgi:hypothetical protein
MVSNSSELLLSSQDIQSNTLNVSLVLPEALNTMLLVGGLYAMYQGIQVRPLSNNFITSCSDSQPGVRNQFTGGTQNYRDHSKEDYVGRIFDLGVRKGVQFLYEGTKWGTISI